MPISGIFNADFSKFTTAVDGAVIKLKDIESGAAKVSTSMSRVAESFSGTKIIQQAIQMAKVFQDAGGAATFTEKELARMGAVAAEATAKMRALGQDVPKSLRDLASATSGAASASDGMGHSWVLRIAEGELLRDAVREVISAVKELAAFLPEIAIKGAVFADVEEGFHHLAASAGLAGDALLGTLRAGTHGTVDDFKLMQRANKDMAAGLDLTNAQFGLLAQGAFALAKVTGTTTTDALDTMSDAMVTGRVKGIALLTGKINLKQAEEDYADSLGGTVEMLTTEQKMHVDQQAVLAKVEERLRALGEQHDSLKDKVDQGKTAWENFKDELGKSIAKSPVIAAGFDSIKKSLAAAFGPDQNAQIAGVASKVDAMAIEVLSLGLAANETARVFHTAWSAVSTVVLGLESGILSVGAGILSTAATLSEMQAKLPFATDGMKRLAVENRAAADSAWLLADGLDAEAREAARGVAQTSDFDKTLDKIGGTLFQTRDAMLAAQAAQAKLTAEEKKGTEAVNEGAEAADKAAEKLKKSKAQEAAAKKEIAMLDADYAAADAERDATANERKVAEINKTFAKLKATLEAQHIFDGQVAADFERNWKQALDGVGTDWQHVSAVSLKAAQQLADNAYRDYVAMLARGDVTREELDKQLAKYRALQLAASAAGHAAAAGQDEASAAAKRHNDALEEQKKKLQDLIEKNDLLVRSRTATTEVTAANLAATITGTRFGDQSITGYAVSGAGYVGSATALAGEGYSFDEILAILRGGRKGKPIGPRIPGFATGIENFRGGAAIVGERGPELLNLPGGSSVRPLGGGGGVIQVAMHVSGVFDPASGSALTNVVNAGITRALLGTRLLG